MENKARHSKQVWEDFWIEKQDIEQVYSNSERIVGQIKSLFDIKGKYIMEIGAGSGRDGFNLSRYGAFVILLDYADSSLHMLKELSVKLDQPVMLVQGDAFNLPFKNDKLDLVYHQGLLEHFTNPEDILKENLRVIKPGGYAISDVPQKYHLYTAVKHFLMWMNKWFAGWETEFTLKQLKTLYQESGFTVYKAYGDWMNPSFIYRAAREVLKKINIKLPLYPKKIPVVNRISTAWKKICKKSKFSFYTFMDIGVIGVKQKGEND